MTTPWAPAGPSVVGNLEKTAPNPPAKPAAKPPVKPQAPFKAAPAPAPETPQAPVLEPPNPVLMQHGYTGGINQFNQRVQNVVDTYKTAYGTPPPPGLIFDLARSKVPDQQFARMFTVPINPVSAQARGTINQHPANDNIVTRPDGLTEQDNPARRLLYNNDVNPVDPTETQPAPTLQRYQLLQQQHPWVAAGMLPLPSGQLSAFWNAIQFAQDHPGATKPLTVGGETLAQYKQENLLGESITGSRPGENPGLATTGYGKKVGPGNLNMAALVQDRQQVARDVTTVKQAQDQLKQLAPTFFAALPSDGFINQDWSKAIGKYQSSAQYFRQQTVRLATDNHFGDNTAAFIHAWQAKQAAIKEQPFLASFLQHQPLAFFDYRTHGGAVKNLLFGNTKGWGWANVPTWGLGALTHVGGLALDEISGTVDQAKIDAAYVTAYMQAIAPKNDPALGQLGWKPLGMTEKQAREHAAKVLHENPTWARVFDPALGTPNDQQLFSKQAAPIFNAAVDLMLGAPKFTGEQVAAGDIAATKASRYFDLKTNLAYNALKQGKIGEASASLEGGLGAERLNTLLEDGVKAGDVSLGQYQHHASEMFSHGETAVGDQTVAGALFRSLRTKDRPTPGPVRTAVQEIHAKVRAVTDQWEETLRARTQQGATSHAVNYISSIRQLTARAAPAGERRYIFAARFPEDTYNWARTQLKAGPDEAAQLRDQAIRLRSRNDIQGITDLFDEARTKFAAIHPDVKIGEAPVSHGPEIESESRTLMYFPAAIETRAQKINAALNKIGKAHRETVVGGSPLPLIPGVFPGIPGFGESLMYKHAVADTTRRVVGGGGVFPVDPAAKALVDGYLKENPEAIRDFGVARSSSVTGETRYITGERPTDPLTFRTGDHTILDKAGKPVKAEAAQEAAGGYLRRNLTSKALKAYQQSSKDNLGPLMDLISKDATFRNLAFKDVRTFTPSTEWQKIPDGISLPTGGEVMERNNIRYVRWADNPPPAIRVGGQTVSQAAEALFNRYQEITDAGVKAGVADPLNQALDVLVKSAGPKGDKKLGKWLADNNIDMPVRDGMVAKSQWDDRMQKWIGTLMTANKWNRGQMFDHVFYGTVQDLVGAGWKTENAVPVAADLAHAQTIYHMLDFSNMLQVEQNLRWLSYFATKHRLYWSWILKQAVARPGLGAAVADVKNQLDSSGNLNFQIYGHQLYVPAARLFWVNPTEYPQTSPIVQFAAEAGKGLVEGKGSQAFADAAGTLTSTSGNLFTRDDQAEALAVKLAAMSAGKIPATADAVTEGMPPSSANQFNAAVNSYSAFFHAQHGDWPNEADAVKHVLLHETARQFWSTNLFLPVLWKGEGSASPKVKQELTTYGHIQDPVKKRAFLEQHPELALRFGVSQDPAVYLHNNRLWDKFNAAEKQVTAARQQIYQEILKGGFTIAVSKQMSALSASWSQKIDQLQLEDAATWQGNPQFAPGRVSDGKVVQPGPWGIQLQGDPFASRAFVHQSFPGIARPQLDAHTVGARIVALQQESATLRAATTPAKIAALGYPDEQHVKERLSEINTILAPFFSYPKDAPAKLQSEYYAKFFTPYATERDKKAAAIALAPQDQQDSLRSQFRAWKDQHDHPVKIEWQGKMIQFPSVVQIGWGRLPEDQRHLGLAQAVTGDWAHIASYEKTMLGVKTTPAVSEGWSLFASTVRDYTKNPSNPNLVASQRTAIAKQIDKYYPGFYKDFLFAAQPKLDRFMATSLYRQMPKDFYSVVVQPAQAFIREIRQNGHRTYYEKAWRNAVETQLMPYIEQDPKLKKALADFGPDFLNTLVSPGG